MYSRQIDIRSSICSPFLCASHTHTQQNIECKRATSKKSKRNIERTTTPTAHTIFESEIHPRGTVFSANALTCQHNTHALNAINATEADCMAIVLTSTTHFCPLIFPANLLSNLVALFSWAQIFLISIRGKNVIFNANLISINAT